MNKKDFFGVGWRMAGEGLRVKRMEAPCMRKGGGGGGDNSQDDYDNYVWIKMPRDILRISSLTATRRVLSHGDHVSILAATITATGGDLDKFIISYATS